MKRILELDEKRTPGRWEWHWVATTDVDYTITCDYMTIAEKKNTNGAGANFAYIAAMPEACAIIRELLEGDE